MDAHSSTVAKVKQAGHEIEYHAYQPETWSRLTPAEEQENLEKSLCIRTTGFVHRGRADEYRNQGVLTTSWLQVRFCAW